MLAAGEPNSAVSFQLSSDLDFHFAAGSVDFSNNTYNLSVVEINDIVRFEISLNLVIVNSEILSIGGEMELSTEHVDAGSASDPHSWGFA